MSVEGSDPWDFRLGRGVLIRGLRVLLKLANRKPAPETINAGLKLCQELQALDKANLPKASEEPTGLALPLESAKV